MLKSLSRRNKGHHISRTRHTIKIIQEHPRGGNDLRKRIIPQKKTISEEDDPRKNNSLEEQATINGEYCTNPTLSSTGLSGDRRASLGQISLNFATSQWNLLPYWNRETLGNWFRNSQTDNPRNWHVQPIRLDQLDCSSEYLLLEIPNLHWFCVNFW